jgi:hypothetical protein
MNIFFQCVELMFFLDNMVFIFVKYDYPFGLTNGLRM